MNVMKNIKDHTKHKDVRTSIHDCKPKMSDRKYSTDPLKMTTSSSSNERTKSKEEEMNRILLLSDPYEILGIKEATVDKNQIKRAYKRMAMKFHPDVVSPDKKEKANEVFAKINAAYEVLTGKDSNSSSRNVGVNNGSKASSSSSSSSYTPPHRRRSDSNTYRTSSSSRYDSNFSWEDFMPKQEEDDKYDTDGDSFAAIFSDLLTGIATGAASASSGKGVFVDLIEFLENNVEGFSSGSYDSDPSLEVLLKTGTREEIRNELDDTQLLTSQLQKKLDDIKFEMMDATTVLNGSESFRVKLEKEETVAQLKARQKIVGEYLQKASKRLLRLQVRFKEFRNTSETTTYSTSTDTNDPTTTDSYSKSRSSSSTSGASSSNDSSRPNSFTSSSSSYSSPSTSYSSSSHWRNQSFGSSGRGRGSSKRQRPTSQTQTTSSNYNNQYSSSYTSPSSSSSTNNDNNYKQNNTATNFPPSNLQGFVPPHRRTSSYKDQVAEDRKRLRELQIEDDFQTLKREIDGLNS